MRELARAICSAYVSHISRGVRYCLDVCQQSAEDWTPSRHSHVPHGFLVSFDVPTTPSLLCARALDSHTPQFFFPSAESHSQKQR